MSPPTERLAREQRYRFRALDESGTVALGELWAVNDGAARDQLARRRLLPTELRIEDGDKRPRPHPDDLQLAVGLRVLASLLDASLPLDRVLGAFGAIAPEGWAPECIEELREHVREGRPLSHAMTETFPRIPAHVMSILAAGEGSGTIAESCRVAAAELELVARTSKSIRAALAYPSLLALAGTVAVVVLVWVVLPRFAELLTDIGQSLPWSTRAVLAVAAGARAALLPAIVFALLAAVLVANWWRSDASAARRVDRALLHSPVAGRLLHSAAGARVAGTLSNLLGAGVTLPAALLQAGAASGNAEIAARVADAATRIHSGERLSRAFALADALPPALTQLVRAGEESGDLVAMLGFGARVEWEHLQERVAALVRLVEPSLILLFGGLVALIAAALLQAIYAVRPA